MRYKFRGKSVQYYTWRYGNLIIHEDGSMAITEGADKFGGQLWSMEVIPESVGQWTGMYDKGGKDIYEGDVVVVSDRGLTAKGVVQKRVDGMYYMHPAKQHGRTWGLDPMYNGKTKAIIIGNVIDSPELMEVE